MRFGGEDVRAGFYQFGHIVGVVLTVTIRVAPRRPAAQKMAIEIQNVIVMRGDVYLRQVGLAADGKRFSEVSKVVQVGGSIPEVMRRPFVLVQSGVKERRRTIRA